MFLLGFTGIYWVFLGFSRCESVSIVFFSGFFPGFTGFEWVSLGSDMFLPSLSGFQWILLSFRVFLCVCVCFLFTGFDLV